jgi:predicted metal-dependent phosphoesterase TrpH
VYRQYLSQNEGCCYVPIQYTDMMEAALAARRSGGITVLAHPSVYDSFDAAFRLAQAGLIDGVECFYPRRRVDMAEQYDRLIKEYGLIPTGGTDFHGLYTNKAQNLATCCTEEPALRRMSDLAAASKRSIIH